MPGNTFQCSLFASKAEAYLSEAPFMCSTRVGSGLTCKHYARLERLARDKNSSLFRSFVKYDCKKLYKVFSLMKLFTSLLAMRPIKLESLSLKAFHLLDAPL